MSAVSIITFLKLVILDNSIYTWGEDKHGQLGHGEETAWKNDPQCVVLLLDKHITQLKATIIDGPDVDAPEKPAEILRKNTRSVVKTVSIVFVSR